MRSRIASGMPISYLDGGRPFIVVAFAGEGRTGLVGLAIE
jgi:hypothetical protein